MKSEQKSVPESRLVLAMVALNDLTLDQGQLFAFLRQAFPDLPGISRSETADSATDILTFALADETVSIALMPVPIPWRDLEGPCATARYWPEATGAMQNHVAHAIVALSGGNGDVLSRHTLLTKVVAAVTTATQAAGVYWGSGTVVHSPERVLEEAGYMGADYLPLDLWIDFRVQRLADNGTRAFTTGLAALGQMEIEVPQTHRQPDGVWDLLHLLASYVLTSGEIIADGDIFGRSESERILVTHAPSMWDRPGPVMRLEM